MRCPNCRAKVVFGRSGISCASCGWHPPSIVQMHYRIAPWTNRRIGFSSLSVAASVALFGLLTGNELFVFIGIVLGASVAAVSVVARDAIIKRMIGQAEAAD